MCPFICPIVPVSPLRVTYPTTGYGPYKSHDNPVRIRSIVVVPIPIRVDVAKVRRIVKVARSTPVVVRRSLFLFGTGQA